MWGYPAIFILVLAILSACTGPPGDPNAVTRPLPSPEKPKTGLDAFSPSPASQRTAAYYASVQTRLLSAGKLRRERDPADARFTATDLVTNFEQIALFDEYSLAGGRFVEGKTASQLRRWETPVRIGLHFGKSVSENQRRIDEKNVQFFANRLARISGLDIQLARSGGANFHILFLNRDEQDENIAQLASEIPQLLAPIATEIRHSPRSIFCAAYALAGAGVGTAYTGAVILVKSEHKSVMRMSCIQEEMAQALGLANDSPQARPSIFNDDEEFALMTTHDELLLKMLYDSRLRLGMTAQTARPYLTQIAQDVLAGPTS